MRGENLTCPIASHNVELKEAAVVMTWGKIVALGKSPPNFVPGPELKTPWRASDHHSYALIPSRGTAVALFTSSLTFSSKVNLPTRSLTLSVIGKVVRQSGIFAVAASLGSQANGSLAEVASERRSKSRIMGYKSTVALAIPLLERKRKWVN